MRKRIGPKTTIFAALMLREQSILANATLKTSCATTLLPDKRASIATSSLYSRAISVSSLEAIWHPETGQKFQEALQRWRYRT